MRRDRLRRETVGKRQAKPRTGFCKKERRRDMLQRYWFNVGKLTAGLPGRREFDALLLLSLLFLAPVSNATQQWQPVDDIAAVAEQFLQDRLGSRASRTTVEAGQLDPRHLLAHCAGQMEPFLRRGSKIAARTIVGVRCTGTKPWTVYVPVYLVVTDTVFVAARTLPKGHRLTEDDLVAEERDVTRLRTGYASSKDELIGQRLKSQLLAGKILTPRLLQADIAVRRGQSVTLIIRNADISIQMAGKALMDGAISQRIRVENSNSGRIVEGIVRSREHVEVLLPPSNRFLTQGPKVSPSVADMRSSNNDR